MSELRPRPVRHPGRRRAVVIGVAAALAVVLVVAVVLAVSAMTGESTPSAAPTKTPTPEPTSTPSPTSTPTPTPTPTFDQAAFSIDDPTSQWVVVNKLRPLNPADYFPSDLVAVPVPYVNAPELRQAVSDAAVAMFAAFSAETGLEMQSQSAFRSYNTQVSVYNGWVNSLGQEGADLTSARPGHSEHQTGLAIDVSARPAVCSLDQCFADTPQGQWLASSGWKFGFIVRYPNGMTPVTGYEYEPWHMRYVGIELATELHNTGTLTLEQFFGLPPAPTYAG